MAILYARGGGLDGPAQPVVACCRIEGEQQMGTCSTMTEDRRQLADGLLTSGGTPVAMERTGVSWRPVFTLREDHLTVLRVNAPPIKAVPGRKTDVRDGEWSGDLLRHGLLKASVMPPRHIRAWRELTRPRQIVVRDRAAVAHRLQTRLEAAHLTLGQVATHGLGLSGRFMLQALADGDEEAAPLAPLAKGTLTAKAAQRKPSLTGHLPPTPRVLLHDLCPPYDH